MSAKITQTLLMRHRLRTVVRCGVVENLTIRLLHLLERMLCVERGDGYIATVDNLQALFVWVDTPDSVVAATLLFSR